MSPLNLSRNVDLKASIKNFQDTPTTSLKIRDDAIALANKNYADGYINSLKSLNADLQIVASEILSKFGLTYTIDLSLAKSVSVAVYELATAANANPMDFNALSLAVRTAHASVNIAIKNQPK